MKKIIFLTFVLFFGIFTVVGQVGIGTVTPNASSALDITSTSGGILIPRMTMAERDLIATPTLGLLIFQTDNTSGFYYYNAASSWVPFTNVASQWVVNANDIYNGNSGNVGVGTNAPTTKLHVENVGTATNILTQDFESTLAPLTTGGAANWQVQSGTVNNGANAAGSGNINDNEVSFMEYSLTVPVDGATLSFFQSVNSETGWDFLRFYIDGAQQSEISGTVAFQQQSYTFTQGTYVLRWAYEKDFTTSVGNDAGYVDDIEINGSAPAALRIVDGNEAQGKVLVSDATGNAAWSNLTAQSISDFPDIVAFQRMEIPICNTNVVNSTSSFNIPIRGVNTTVTWTIIEQQTTAGAVATVDLAGGGTVDVIAAPFRPERLQVRYDFSPQLPFDPQGFIFAVNNDSGFPDTFNLNYANKSQNAITVNITRTDIQGDQTATCWAGQFFFDVVMTN